MTVLLSPDRLAARRLIARGALAPLAQSLRADLTPVVDAGAPWFPAEKARLTRLGGRCPAHGALLEFDPWQPRAHRCPVCGTVYHEEEHYRWWIMNYQLWLAERAVHAATLHALTDDAACGSLAADILRGYARVYDRYPNRDNVLGPTRLFFSTYLEAIWLLQLTVALDLLEGRDGRSALGDEVRERLLRPSATIIASFDEGLSNRQVYNNAAIAAAGAVLGDDALVARATDGPSGLAAHLARGLLADGTWYEGENYHLFAHRGLWYGVHIAEAAGRAISSEGLRRFREAFATPFASALPDFTSPSRRDSQYRVSLRQWRIAESCELGLARGDDDRLVAALHALYAPTATPGESGRARSTAEAERNVPPVRLSRHSLGWKSLLFAREALPPLEGRVPSSVHLAGQGIAVLRRDEGRTYLALDYGESGGGHGHPDRLNLWLVVGDARVLEDVGTGSYVDPTLHWYRSTLAHNAPLADGRSQWQTAGALTAYDEGDGASLVSARAAIAPGVTVERSLVVMTNYAIDEVRWTADRVITFDLPMHVDAEFGAAEAWRPATLGGGHGLEDGFDFVASAEHRSGRAGVAFDAAVGDVRVRAWVDCDVPHEWWRCVAPGPPGQGRRRFLVLRARERSGVVRTVWSWTGDVASCSFDAVRTSVLATGGARHEHTRAGSEWRITRLGEPGPSSTTLATTGESDQPGVGRGTGPETPSASDPIPPVVIHPAHGAIPSHLGTLAVPGALDRHDAADTGRSVARFFLGRDHYRRSEARWEDAGAPRAVVAVAAGRSEIVVEVAVSKRSPVFAPPMADNALDNEHPDINSDGVQLYLGSPQGSGRYYSWILVPELPSGRVRVTARTEFGPPVLLTAHACLTVDGWVVRASIPRSALAPIGAADFTLDCIVNEISADRERRGGQLVLSGGHEEWIYLRGDRQDSARALSFHVADD